MTSLKETYHHFTQGNEYLTVQTLTSALNNYIYQHSPSEEQGPIRKELLSSYINSAVTQLYTPLFAVATDKQSTNKITIEQFERVISIIEKYQIEKNSDSTICETVLFEILDDDHDGKVPTDEMIHFIIKMSQQSPSDEAKEGVRQTIDSENKGFVILDDFIKTMNM